MGAMFLKKILDKDFERLTTEELQAIIINEDIFSISKKDKKVLEKIIEDGITEGNNDKMVAVLKEGLPNPFAILSNLDKHSLVAGEIKIDFREIYKRAESIGFGSFVYSDRFFMMKFVDS